MLVLQVGEGAVGVGISAWILDANEDEPNDTYQWINYRAGEEM